MSTKDEYSEMLEHRLTYTTRWTIIAQQENDHIKKIIDLLKQYDHKLPPEFEYQLCDGLLKLFELYEAHYEIANLLKETIKQEMELINKFRFED